MGDRLGLMAWKIYMDQLNQSNLLDQRYFSCLMPKLFQPISHNRPNYKTGARKNSYFTLMQKNSQSNYMKESENLTTHIRRRVVFLLNEALLKSPRDQVITYCMRALSNYATVGFDSGSYKIKITNQRVSREAEALLKNSTSLKEWADGCINEHEIPLKEIWEWLYSEAYRLTPDEVWSKFSESKMVTVTKEEDKKLNSSGLKSKSGAIGRYVYSGIEVVDLSLPPHMFFRIKKSNN